MKKTRSVVLCTVLMISLGAPTCCPSLADAVRPVFSLAPEFLRSDVGEFMFHSLPWESTVEETESALNVSIGEPDFTGPDYLPTLNTRFFRIGEFTFPFLETPDTHMLEYYFVDGKLRSVEVTVYSIRGMSKDMVYENLTQLYLDAFGEPFQQTESDIGYAVDGREAQTTTTRWIADPHPDGTVTFLALRGHERAKSMYSIMITLGVTDISYLEDSKR